MDELPPLDIGYKNCEDLLTAVSTGTHIPVETITAYTAEGNPVEVDAYIFDPSKIRSLSGIYNDCNDYKGDVEAAVHPDLYDPFLREFLMQDFIVWAISDDLEDNEGMITGYALPVPENVQKFEKIAVSEKYNISSPILIMDPNEHGNMNKSIAFSLYMDDQDIRFDLGFSKEHYEDLIRLHERAHAIGANEQWAEYISSIRFLKKHGISEQTLAILQFRVDKRMLHDAIEKIPESHKYLGMGYMVQDVINMARKNPDAVFSMSEKELYMKVHEAIPSGYLSKGKALKDRFSPVIIDGNYTLPYQSYDELKAKVDALTPEDIRQLSEIDQQAIEDLKQSMARLDTLRWGHSGLSAYAVSLSKTQEAALTLK